MIMLPVYNSTWLSIITLVCVTVTVIVRREVLLFDISLIIIITCMDTFRGSFMGSNLPPNECFTVIKA